MGMNARQSNYSQNDRDFGMPPSGNRYIGLGGKNMSNHGDDPTSAYSRGSQNNQMGSNEDISEARQSLMLLKSKMKNKVPQRYALI